MEEFKNFLMQLIGSVDWQDPENCKAAAKEIMELFAEKVGNRARDIINGIYFGLYAGFDAVSDTLKENGIDGINLWTALHLEVTERYDDKPLVRSLAVLAVIAQEVRCYNDVAYKKFQETNVVDEVLITRVVERLTKMRPYASGTPIDKFTIDADVSVFSKKIGAVIFANTFRQLDMVMYNNGDQMHVTFIGFFNDCTQSKTIVEGYGEELAACAEQLMCTLDTKSEYRRVYSDISRKLR
jgi:hypothetical protein